MRGGRHALRLSLCSAADVAAASACAATFNLVTAAASGILSPAEEVSATANGDPDLIVFDNASVGGEALGSPPTRPREGVMYCSRRALLLSLVLWPWGPALGGAVPADGTYTGTTQSGFDVVVEVAGGQVTGWSAGHSVAMCVTVPDFITSNCTTTGTGFTCGAAVFCAPTAAPQFFVEGTFTGETVSGTFDFRFQGPVIVIPPPCCIANDVSWSAARVSELVFRNGFEEPG